MRPSRYELLFRLVAFGILFFLFFASYAVLVQGQEAEPDYTWHLSVSSNLIYIGETLWCNVTGFPDRVVEVTFTCPLNNYSFSEFLVTNHNGSASHFFAKDFTEQSGHYVVALSVNNTVFEAIEVDIIWDRDMAQDLRIDGVWDALGWSEDDPPLVSQESWNRQYRENDSNFARDLAEVKYLLWAFVVLVVFFIMFFAYIHWEKIVSDYQNYQIEKKRSHRKVGVLAHDDSNPELLAAGEEYRFDKDNIPEGQGLEGMEGKTTDEAVAALVEHAEEREKVNIDRLEAPAEEKAENPILNFIKKRRRGDQVEKKD